MKLTWLIGSIAIIACAGWAIFLQEDSSIDPITIDLRQAAPLVKNDTDQSLDITAFTANLWNPPPVKKTSNALAKKELPRAKPLRLQLIGITSDGDTLRAAIYDPDSDQLLIVASGDTILGRAVSEITKNTVVIADGRFTHHLQLVEDEWDKGDDGL